MLEEIKDEPLEFDYMQAIAFQKELLENIAPLFSEVDFYELAQDDNKLEEVTASISWKDLKPVQDNQLNVIESAYNPGLMLASFKN